MTQLVSVLALVMLFLFGLQTLSLELEKLAQDQLRLWFQKLSQHTVLSWLLGFASTVVVQSSSAISVLALSLLNSKLLDLRTALLILMGANVGTASTAFLVSAKIQHLGDYLIVLGSILSFLKLKTRVLGKSIFYFGLILFTLDQLAMELKNPNQFQFLVDYLKEETSAWHLLLWGILSTIIFQSSSVVTGLVVLLGQQGLLELTQGLYVILGSNIGTTSTGFIGSLQLDTQAKHLALWNTFFNTFTALIIFPTIPWFAQALQIINGSQHKLGLQHAMGHLGFNLVLSLFFFPTLEFWLHLYSKWMNRGSS